MRPWLLCVVLAAGCATSAEDLKRMSTAEVCYLGAVEPEKRAVTDAEIKRRNEDCSRHEAEMRKIEDQERRAGQIGGGVGEGVRPSGGTGGMGGMGGRGY